MAPFLAAVAAAVSALAAAGAAQPQPPVGQEGACARSEQPGETCALLQARTSALQAPAPAPAPVFVECSAPLVNVTVRGELRAGAGCSLRDVTVVGSVVASDSLTITGGEVTGDFVAKPSAQAAAPRLTRIEALRVKGNILMQHGSGDLHLFGAFVVGTVELVETGKLEAVGGQMGSLSTKNSGRLGATNVTITANLMVQGGFGDIFLKGTTVTKVTVADVAGSVVVDGCAIFEGFDALHVSSSLMVTNSKMEDNAMSLLGIGGTVSVVQVFLGSIVFDDINSSVLFDGITATGSVAMSTVHGSVRASHSSFKGASMSMEGTGAVTLASCSFGQAQMPLELTVKSASETVKVENCKYLGASISYAPRVVLVGSTFSSVTISDAGSAALANNTIDLLACSDNTLAPEVNPSNTIVARQGQCELPLPPTPP